MSTHPILAAIVVAFAVTIAFVFALRPIAIALGFVDRPGGRKSHIGEIPTLGGVAMFAGLIAGITLIPEMWTYIPALLVASLILVTIGAVDDRFHLPSAVRFVAQIAVVLIMVSGATFSISSIGDPFGTGEIVLGRFALIFTVLVSLTMINAFNLIDGADGLAGTLAIITFSSVAIVGGTALPGSLTALVSIAVVIGFLIFNFPVHSNRKILTFMGDAGSTLLGFTVVWTTINISQGTDRLISPVLCLWFAAIPIFDTLTCFVIRIAKRKSPFTPGRDHFHHILKRGGFGPLSKLGVLAGLQVVYSIAGLTGYYAGFSDFIMFVCWSLLGLTQQYVVKLVARSNRANHWHRRQRV